MNDPLHPRRDGGPKAAGTTADERVGRALVRLESTLEQKPGFGNATHCSTSDNPAGVRCRSSEGDHRIETDLPAALGGTAGAPSPSALLRAALGSCLAIGYRLRAARHGVPLGAIRVTVETDSALAGMLLTSSTAHPGYLGIRYHIEIETDLPLAGVRQLVHEADRLSPVLDTLGRVNRPQSSLTIVGGGG